MKGVNMQELKEPDSKIFQLMVCGRPLDVFLNDIEHFHGFVAPGLVLGGFMVDWARDLVGLNVESDAIVETCHCLPDSIQIFTPCTIGNGWLKVLDWDKFALTLYDKRKLTGYRVWFDLEKAALFPKIQGWYMRSISKKDLPLEVLLEEIIRARRSVLSCRAVRVISHYRKKSKGDIAVCSGCGEAYPASQGNQCSACRGEGYYRF